MRRKPVDAPRDAMDISHGGEVFSFVINQPHPRSPGPANRHESFFPFLFFWWNKKNGFSVPHYKIDIFLNSHGAHTGRVHNMMNGNQNWPKRNRTTSMTMCSVTRSFGSLSLYRTFYATKFTKDWETGSHFWERTSLSCMTILYQRFVGRRKIYRKAVMPFTLDMFH
jgi:hypothetical protein